MTTNIVLPSKEDKPLRYIIHPFKQMSGDVLTVYKVKVKTQGSMIFTDMHLVKLTGSVFMDVKTRTRYRLKVLGTNQHHALHAMGNTKSTKPYYIYKINELDAILALGKEK